MRNYLLGAAAAIAIASTALAANIPLLSGPGPQEPSQTLATDNALIGSVIFGVSGWLASTGTVTSTATTVLQTFATTSIPTSQINVPGQGLHVHCWGTTGANTNGKSVIVRLGSNQVSGGTATSGLGWDLEIFQIANTVTANSGVIGRGSIGSTLLTTISSTDTTDNFTTAENASCLGQQNTSSAADIVLQGFMVEQWK